MPIKYVDEQIKRIKKIKKSMDSSAKKKKDRLAESYKELEKLQGQVDEISFENTSEYNDLYELEIVSKWLKKNKDNITNKEEDAIPSKPVKNKLTTHVVKSGDTLGIISKKYGVSVNELIKKNNIKDKNLIGIGQKIIIPKRVVKPDSKTQSGTDNKKYFPVKNSNGVNFWVTPHGSNLKSNMDYGRRTQGKFHSGYDIGMGGNANVSCHAVRAGKIEAVVDSSGGRGLYIIVDHSSDKYKTLYQHLKKNSSVVKKGDVVKAGQKIAMVGNTPVNYGYAIHLHIEVSRTGVFGGTESEKIQNTIDPKKYLEVTADNKTNLPRPK